MCAHTESKWLTIFLENDFVVSARTYLVQVSLHPEPTDTSLSMVAKRQAPGKQSARKRRMTTTGKHEDPNDGLAERTPPKILPVTVLSGFLVSLGHQLPIAIANRKKRRGAARRRC